MVIFQTLAILVGQYITYVLQYRKTPLMSTSLTAASTIGTLTIAGPKPTSKRTPPDFVA